MSGNEKSIQATAGAFWRQVRRRLVQLALGAAAILLAISSVVFVDETELVLVERFGKIRAVYDRPEDRGLHFKAPWPIDLVRSFDSRVQLFDPLGREMFTRDKKNITVHAYVCWKIAEPREAPAENPADRPVVKFFRGLGSASVAEQRLDSRLRSVLATEIGKVELSTLLSVSNSEAGPDATQSAPLDAISQSVKGAVARRGGEAESLAESLGIEIVDVRIKRLNLPAGNQQAVFERMKSERRKIADRYRSAGLAENKMITSQADRQYNELLSRARADAERIRGEGEAEAIAILNRAHAQDPEFYKTLQTLDAYRKILNEKTTLVLSASSNLLKMLTDGVPELPNSPNTPAPSGTTEPSVPPAGDTPDVSADDASKSTAPLRQAQRDAAPPADAPTPGDQP